MAAGVGIALGSGSEPSNNNPSARFATDDHEAGAGEEEEKEAREETAGEENETDIYSGRSTNGDVSMSVNEPGANLGDNALTEQLLSHDPTDAPADTDATSDATSRFDRWGWGDVAAWLGDFIIWSMVVASIILLWLPRGKCPESGADDANDDKYYHKHYYEAHDSFADNWHVKCASYHLNALESAAYWAQSENGQLFIIPSAVLYIVMLLMWATLQTKSEHIEEQNEPIDMRPSEAKQLIDTLNSTLGHEGTAVRS